MNNTSNATPFDFKAMAKDVLQNLINQTPANVVFIDPKEGLLVVNADKTVTRIEAPAELNEASVDDLWDAVNKAVPGIEPHQVIPTFGMAGFDQIEAAYTKAQVAPSIENKTLGEIPADHYIAGSTGGGMAGGLWLQRMMGDAGVAEFDPGSPDTRPSFSG